MSEVTTTFEGAVAPLLAAYEHLESAIAEREAELSGLKDQRARLRTAVRALAPERLPEGKNTKPRGRTKFSSASKDYVREFLNEHITGVFGAANILGHPNYKGVGGTTLPTVLRSLHEDGAIRLVRKGKGHSRYYEVIR